MGIDQQGDVLLAQHRVQVGLRHAVALAILDDLVHQRETAVAFFARAIEVVEHRQAERGAGLQHGRRDRRRIVRRLAPDRSALAAIMRVGLALPVLQAPVDAQRMLVAPVLVAGHGHPVIEILPERPRPDGGVDAAAAADHAPHVLGNGAVVDVARTLGHEGPVARRAEVGEPLARIGHRWRVVPVAGLDQQDFHVRVGGKPVDDGAAGAAGAAHDIVVGAQQRLAALGLVGTDGVQIVGQRADADAEQPGRPHEPHEIAAADAAFDERRFQRCLLILV